MARARVDIAEPGGLRWRDPPVVGVALLALAAGFGQFGATAALGDVAKTFGHLTHGATFTDQAGLSGTVLGVGLAVIRLASLGGLPLTGLADRLGRRRVALATCALGLAITVVAAASPGYWWFVALFALGRPFLSATTGVTQVSAAELTSTAERAKAIALVAAGYAVGAGATAVLHSLAGGQLGFRGLFALAVVPLVLLPVVARWVTEPDRFQNQSKAELGEPVLGPIERRYRGRLAMVCLVAFGVSVITGPANTLVFIYAQNVRHVPGPITAAMVVGAGATGLVGLLVGRWLADRVGRRPAVALAVCAMAFLGVLTYSGSSAALVIGYVCGVLAAAVFAPAGGAMANELFPTSVRASVAGWYLAAGVLGAVVGLVVFGAVADVGGVANHTELAALATFVPAVLFLVLLVFLPETRGRELEELWPAHRP